MLIFNFFLVPYTLLSQHKLHVGLIEGNEMETLYHLKWFSKKYTDFTPTVSSDEDLSKDLIGSDFIVFMGSWCHDTKMLLPKFFKLLDNLEIPKDRTTLYNVDKKKRHPRTPIKKYGIKYVPTIIFMRDGEEVGRIVEFPFYSLEGDISKMYARLKKDLKE